MSFAVRKGNETKFFLSLGPIFVDPNHIDQDNFSGEKEYFSSKKPFVTLPFSKKVKNESSKKEYNGMPLRRPATSRPPPSGNIDLDKFNSQ